MLTANGIAWVGLINNKGTTMKYAKTLKENLQLVKEGGMPESKGESCRKFTESLTKARLGSLKVGDTFKIWNSGTTFYIVTSKDDGFIKFKDKSNGKEESAPKTMQVYLVTESKKIVENSIKMTESAKKIEEARADGKVIRFDTFGGGLEVNLSREGFSLYGFGSGVVDYKKPGFTYEDMDEKTYRNLISDIAHFANRFDKDVKDVMAKYGFKK